MRTPVSSKGILEVNVYDTACPGVFRLQCISDAGLGFTCAEKDHLLWSVWGGNKWPVRFVLPEAHPDKAGHAAGSLLV